MSDEAEDRARREFNEVINRFASKLTVGDPYFFLRSYRSWNIDPVGKTVIPAIRVAVGDSNGEVVFNRSVLLSGLVDLVDELASLLKSESASLEQLGFDVDLPMTKPMFNSSIRRIESKLEATKNSLDLLQFKMKIPKPQAEE